MKKSAVAIGLLLVLAVLYLLLWPVPVDPLAWDAPSDSGLVDPFAPDKRLSRAQAIDLGDHEGPEDIAAGRDGRLYATTAGGAILQIGSYRQIQVFADVGGRPLGIETAADGSLIVANAHVGLQRVLTNGSVQTLLSEVEGQPLVYADDLAIAADGTVYFSEASSKFGAKEYSGTYESSLLDIMEHGGHGRVIEFDPATGEAHVIISDLNFANGIAISRDQEYLLVAETGAYRILKHWLKGANSGSTEILLDNLPGFPDNINNGMRSRFWIGLVAPRSALLDKLSDKPFVRKIVQRLPAVFRPKAAPSSHVVAINGDGQVLIDLQDPEARYPALTGVLETGDKLYLTALFGNKLAWLDKADL